MMKSDWRDGADKLETPRLTAESMVSESGLLGGVTGLTVPNVRSQ